MKISIFMPVYNGEAYLERTVGSVLGQVYNDWELVAVDDSSTDGSHALLQRFAAADQRIRPYRKPNGGDVPHSWLYAMPLFGGDFVLYMSQDDLLEPDTLRLLAERQQQTDADVVFSHEVHYIEGLAPERMHHLRGIAGDTTPVIGGTEAFRLMIDYSISGRGLWRSSVIRRIGMGTDTYNADELAQRRWALACRRVAFSEAVFLYRQDNPQSITRRFVAHSYGDSLTNAQLFALAQGALPADAELLRSMANRYFYLLYLRMLHYLQHRRDYTPAERRMVRGLFRRAYRLLHRRCTLRRPKYRLAAAALPLMWAVASWHCLNLRRKGIAVNADLDCYSYTVPE